MCFGHEFLGNLVEKSPILQLLLGSIALDLLLFVVPVTWWVVLMWAPHETVSVAVVHPFLVQYLVVVFLQGHRPSHEAAVGVLLHDCHPLEGGQGLVVCFYYEETAIQIGPEMLD